MLQVKNLSFSYRKEGEENREILHHISCEINAGDYIGLIGSSGCGKTTLVKHFNGLLKASSGEIFFENRDIYEKNYPLSFLRKEVGLVFQYPEHQLFGKTVLSDVMYGPLNLGMTEADAEESARESLKLVGIQETHFSNSPFELSGGQKRCVAIAGILAMHPKILILDEPAAGLDPETKHMIFRLIDRIRTEKKIAIVFVSHHMEDVAKYANQVWVLHQGELALQGTPEEVFSQVGFLKEIGVGIPQVTDLTMKLMEEDLPFARPAVTVEDAEKMILELIGQEERDDS